MVSEASSAADGLAEDPAGGRASVSNTAACRDFSEGQRGGLPLACRAISWLSAMQDMRILVRVRI